MVLELAELKRRIADGRIDTVVVAFPDMQGRPVGKRVTSAFFLDHVLEHGIEACDYLLAVDVDMEPLPGYRFASWDTGYGDVVALVDLTTARALPWLDGSALVICDVVDRDGSPVEVSPRRILKRQTERAAHVGLDVRCATELEFYLFRESFEEAAAQGWRDLHPHTSTIEDYQLLQTSREEYVIRRIRNEMPGAGVPVEFSKGEAGRGQHEVNVTYGRALEVADRHLVFKNGVKEIAAQCGRSASFMAKWSMGEAGSSCHVHASLWDNDAGTPLTSAGDEPWGLSETARHFLAGLVEGARQLTWLWAPYVNSYRRFVPGSWAPTAAVWGVDNRTCGLRVVGHGDSRRIECRIPGADVNPYLALAGVIAAGLWGVEHGLELGEPFAGNAYVATDVARIPTTLVEAIAAFEASAIAAEAFGEEVHFHLTNTARQEWAKANQAVTDWELARNFERI
ncbi:MAG TPA: glutamine synthetase family protein [Acidimicrobiales bacterium]|nr:glutamine synthetase family protein [Acidimicrobiales bacterium]